MKPSNDYECPNCGEGTVQANLLGSSIEFRSDQPGDAVVTEVYGITGNCTANQDAPTYTTKTTDCATGEVREVNNYL